MKRRASISRMKTIIECFKYCIQCPAFAIFEKESSDRMTHYRGLEDDMFAWSDVKFPVGNNETDRFKQNNKGLVAINVFEPDDVFNHKRKIPIKSVRSM